VADVGDLQRVMVAEKIGGRIALRVFRGGEEHMLDVIPVELDER